MPFNDKERELLNNASDFKNFRKSENEFKLIFMNYAKNIISRQFCWNHDLEPEDLVQETIIKALNNENKYQAGSNLKNWVYTLMLNIHRDYKRKNNYEFSVEENDLLNLIDISNDKKINKKTIFFENDQKKDDEEKIKIIYSIIKDLPQVEREIYKITRFN